MSIKIHPYLMARLVAVQAAFGQPGFRPALAMNSPAPATPSSAAKGNNWKEIIKDEDEQGGEGGQGRGTMRGHRGKNAEHAKAAMRKLTRNR